MGKIKIKKGSWGADVEDLGRVEIRFRRPTTAQRFGMAPLVGRAATEVAKHWMTYDEIKVAANAAADVGDEAGHLVALQRLAELPQIWQPQTWEDVAELLAEYCEQLTIDGDQIEDAEEIAEALRYLPGYDAENALQRLYKATDGLSAEEGKPSEPTSDT